MKRVIGNVYREVKILKSNVWAQIRDARTNEVISTGTPEYIQRVARKKFNVKISTR